jgi:hypothetical protein
VPLPPKLEPVPDPEPAEPEPAVEPDPEPPVDVPSDVPPVPVPVPVPPVPVVPPVPEPEPPVAVPSVVPPVPVPVPVPLPPVLVPSDVATGSPKPTDVLSEVMASEELLVHSIVFPIGTFVAEQSHAGFFSAAHPTTEVTDAEAARIRSRFDEKRRMGSTSDGTSLHERCRSLSEGSSPRWSHR